MKEETDEKGAWGTVWGEGTVLDFHCGGDYTVVSLLKLIELYINLFMCKFIVCKLCLNKSDCKNIYIFKDMPLCQCRHRSNALTSMWAGSPGPWLSITATVRMVWVSKAMKALTPNTRAEGSMLRLMAI